MRFVFLAALAFLGRPIWATDANTNCDSACEVTQRLGGFERTYTDPLCRSRCLVEKGIAQRTGITSCGLWTSNPNLAVFFVAAKEAITEANHRWGVPSDVHNCHDYMDAGATNASRVGALYKLYEAYELGVRAAARVNVAGWVVSEGVKHFAHCACSAARYRDTVEAPPAQDTTGFFVSLTSGDGNWVVRQTSAVRANEEIENAKRLLRRPVLLRTMGYIDVSKPTITEVICQNRAWTQQGSGFQSLETAVREAERGRLADCQFRVTNAQTLGGLSDIRYASLVKGTQWALRWGTGPDDNAELNLVRQFLNLQPNQNPDQQRLGNFSSSRITGTIAQCHAGTSSPSPGIVISDDVVLVKAGRGGSSLKEAFDEASGNGYKRCIFETHDLRFATQPFGLTAPRHSGGGFY